MHVFGLWVEIRAPTKTPPRPQGQHGNATPVVLKLRGRPPLVGHKGTPGGLRKSGNKTVK